MIFKKGDFINDCEILEIHNNPNKNKITLDVRCLKCGRTRNVCYKNIVDGPALSTKHGKSCAEQVSTTYVVHPRFLGSPSVSYTITDVSP